MTTYPKVLAVGSGVPTLLVIQVSATTGRVLSTDSKTLNEECDLHRLMKFSGPFENFNGDAKPILALYDEIRKRKVGNGS